MVEQNASMHLNTNFPDCLNSVCIHYTKVSFNIYTENGNRIHFLQVILNLELIYLQINYHYG